MQPPCPPLFFVGCIATSPGTQWTEEACVHMCKHPPLLYGSLREDGASQRGTHSPLVPARGLTLGLNPLGHSQRLLVQPERSLNSAALRLRESPGGREGAVVMPRPAAKHQHGAFFLSISTPLKMETVFASKVSKQELPSPREAAWLSFTRLPRRLWDS